MYDEIRDEFLSEEDLDLQNLSREELEAYWEIWFRQAQATNHLDYNTYSHGVFVTTTDPAAEPPDPEEYRALMNDPPSKS